MDLEQHGIGALFRIHPGLRLAPSPDDSIRIVGRLRFNRTFPGKEAIDDNYELKISVPSGFPNAVPLVWESGGRIPQEWHRNPGMSLCLGTPTAIRLRTLEVGTMDKFVEVLVVPYLYQHSYYENYGEMPFGELDHGIKGVLRDFQDRFAVGDENAARGMVFLASLRRRVANKWPCPCGVGMRLGRCWHRWKVNAFRKAAGRGWSRVQFREIEKARTRGEIL